jgi:hypothetical protein
MCINIIPVQKPIAMKTTQQLTNKTALIVTFSEPHSLYVWLVAYYWYMGISDNTGM